MSPPLLTLLIMVPAFTLAFTSRHLLSCLILLEMLTLSTIIIIPIITLPYAPSEMSTLITILVMSACETSIALSCVISVVRAHGQDMLATLHTLSL